MSGCLKTLLTAVMYGLALFFAGVAFLIYTGNPPNLYNTLSKSLPVSAESVVAEQEGKLVSVTGMVECGEPNADHSFLKSTHHMKIFRDVEMYSWQKKRNTRRGYDEYSRTWTRTPSKNVGISYENPEMGLRMMTFVASSGQIGSYSFDPLEAKFAVDANDYSTATPLKISQENLNHDNDSLRLELFEDHVGSPRTGEILAKKRFASTDGKYVYLVNDLPSTPEIGDLRLSYHVIQDRYQATAFGVLKGKQLTRIGPGIRTFVLPGERQVALANLKRDAGTAMLITRIELYVLLNLIVLIVLIPFFAFSWFTNRPQNPSRLVESLLAVCISLIVSTTMTVASIFVYDMRIVLVFLFLVIAAILLFLFARFLLRRPSPGPQ